MPEKEAVDIMKQLMSAVTYLHENDIIHRDIKLGNILRHEDVVKLGDFGLACNYRTDDVKQLCGTPNFLPPEVFKVSSLNFLFCRYIASKVSLPLDRI